MNETDVLHMFLARRDNYTVTSVAHLQGRIYRVLMDGKSYNAVVLPSSFDFFEKRYHLASNVPDLVICYEHNTVLPISVLSLRLGSFAHPYELPEGIYDVEAQRKGRVGSRVLLGMYLSGVKKAQTVVNALPAETRRRYLLKIKALGKRTRGKPVGRASR